MGLLHLILRSGNSFGGIRLFFDVVSEVLQNVRQFIRWNKDQGLGVKISNSMFFFRAISNLFWCAVNYFALIWCLRGQCPDRLWERNARSVSPSRHVIVANLS